MDASSTRDNLNPIFTPCKTLLSLVGEKYQKRKIDEKSLCSQTNYSGDRNAKFFLQDPGGRKITSLEKLANGSIFPNLARLGIIVHVV
jgi:hypothetical protein